jgi:DNA repair exonuclease SbcCD ATPase subunit
MRLAELEIAGFRAFSRAEKFSLDADAVLIVAPNGQGKTSLFDAIFWGLAGTVPRLGGNDKGLLSLYSQTGEMHVRLAIKDAGGQLFHITRSSDGTQQRVTLERAGETFKDTAATARILEQLWPAALMATDPGASFSAAITRSVYLQQDLVRQFLESEQGDRFNLISDLVGTGRLTELQLQLDTSRSAWSRATNDRLSDSKSLRDRILALEAQVEKLGTSRSNESFSPSEWQTWWHQVGPSEFQSGDVPDWQSYDATLVLDSALKQLQARKNSLERAKVLTEQLIADAEKNANVVLPDRKALTEKLSAIQREVDQDRALLKEAQQAAAAERRRQVARAQESEELKALAQLALRHLGDHCPVCEQAYDKTKTANRLKKLAEVTMDEVARSPQQIRRVAEKAEEHERALIEAEASLKRADLVERNHATWLSDCDRRARELGVDPGASSGLLVQLRKLLAQFAERSSLLQRAQDDGERMALQLARSAESARKNEAEKELSVARQMLHNFEVEQESRQKTWDLATRILEELREAATEFVESELKRIEPLLQRIYSRIDPHPSLRLVKFLTSFTYRRGRLLMSILDPEAEVSSDSPETVLSSSQLNALAVSVFLALNLGVTRLPLQAAMLDDPLQSLDDINLLGVIDLLRRTKDARQLIVSTHDSRFGDLMIRKLRSVKQDQTTRVIELDGWAREGPIVEQRDGAGDLHPLKIAI